MIKTQEKCSLHAAATCPPYSLPFERISIQSLRTWSQKETKRRKLPIASSESVQRAAFHVQSASKEEVTGSNVLVAIFAERASHAAFFLQEQGITRYDVINYTAHGIIKETALARVNSRIKEAAASAPQFKEKGGRLSYTERTAVGNLKQRKLAVAERLDCLRSICTARSNEQPQLSLLANRYSEALKRTSC